MRHLSKTGLVVAASAFGIVGFASGGVASAAGSGYGGTPVQVVVPSGFSTVAFARTIGNSRAILAATITGFHIDLAVPQGEHAHVQIAVTVSVASHVPLPRVLKGWTQLTGFGVLIRHQGTEVRLREPVTMSIVNPHVQPRDIVLIYNAAVHRFVRARYATIRGDSVTVHHLRRGQSVSIVQPPKH